MIFRGDVVLLHDHRLLGLISNARRKVAAATSNAELLRVIDAFISFRGDVKLSFIFVKAMKIVGYFSYGMAAILILIGIKEQEQDQVITRYIPPLMMLAVTLGLVFITLSEKLYRERGNLLHDLGRGIARASALIGMGAVPDKLSKSKRLANLEDRFSDYDRGLRGRELVDVYFGTTAGKEHSLPYCVAHLHFPDENANHGLGYGLYKPSVRFSLVISFPWVRSVSVRSDGHAKIDRPVRWAPASSDFEQSFVLTGLTEMACSKFATPATALLLLRLGEYLRDLNLEFSDDGALCVSFSDCDVLLPDVDCSWHDPAAFRRAIFRVPKLPRLEMLLADIHELAGLHDSGAAS